MPVTVVEFTAGDEDVTIEGLTFELTGRVDRDIFDSVVLLDENGMIVGGDETENIDSDDEVEFSEEIEVEAGETVEITLAVNATAFSATPWNGEDDDEFSFDLIEVEANADVDGLPVTSGAEHTVDADDNEIDGVTVEIDHETTSDLEIGSEDELIVTLTIASDDNNSDDDESVFVKSVRFENEGTADLEDLDDIYVEVDGDEFNGDVDGDYITFDFGNGVEIENDEEEDFELFVTVTSDADAQDTIRLQVTESSDLYAETEDGYGAPVTVNDTDNVFPVADSTNDVTIEAGSATLSTSSEDEGEDVVPGEDILLGQFDFEVEGEALIADELTLTVTLSTATTTSGDEEDLLLEDVYITDADGNVLVSTEDAEGVSPSATQTIEFEDVEFPVGDHEDLRVLATINDEVADGTSYEITGFVFTGAEGEDSGETITVSGSPSFSDQEVSGSVLEVSVSDGDEDETSDDVEDFVFAVLELDASDSGEDVEVTSVELQVTYSLPIAQTVNDAVEDVTSCALYLDGDKVSDTEDLDESDFSPAIDHTALATTTHVASYDFNLDDVVAVSEGGDATELELRCDIGDNDLKAGDAFQWGIDAAADVDAEGTVTGTDGDDFLTISATVADEVTIVAAGLDVDQTENFDENKVVQDDADGVVLLEVEVEGVDGTATIDDITATLLMGDGTMIEQGDVDIYVDGDKEGELEFGTGTTGSETSLNIEVKEDEKLTVQFRVDIDTNADPADVLQLRIDTIVLEDAGAVNGLTITSAETTIFEAVPVIALESDVTNDLSITNVDYELIEFTIKAEGEDLFVDSVSLDITEFSNINAFTATLEVFDSSDTSGTPDEEVDVAVSAAGVVEFNFTDFEISENDEYHFVLTGDVTASGDPAVIAIEIQEDSMPTATTSGIQFVANDSGTGPNTLDSSEVLEDDITVTHSYTD